MDQPMAVAWGQTPDERYPLPEGGLHRGQDQANGDPRRDADPVSDAGEYDHCGHAAEPSTARLNALLTAAKRR